MFEQVAEILANQLGISKDKVTLESEIIKGGTCIVIISHSA